MNIYRTFVLGAGIGGLIASGGCISSIKTSAQADAAGATVDRRALSEATIAQWSDISAQAARRVMEEYGTPDEVHHDYLVWNNNEPWRRTIVLNKSPLFVEGDELGVIEQTIELSLSPMQAANMAAFDGRVVYNPRNQELSASSDREENNYLRLNIAQDVVKGAMRPDQARNSYARILNLEESGKSSPYMVGLRFTPGI